MTAAARRRAVRWANRLRLMADVLIAFALAGVLVALVDNGFSF